MENTSNSENTTMTAQDEMKNRLGFKYIGEGVTLTDNLSNRKFKIVAIEKDGLTIAEIVSLGKGEETPISYKDLLDKFDKYQITVSGYEKTEEDKIIFHQVIREIESGYALNERDSTISQKDNQINELTTEEQDFKSGGVVGKVKSNKHGYVSEIRNQYGKLISEVQVGDKTYIRNGVYKTYNSVEGNELLRKEDTDKVKIAKRGTKIKEEDKSKEKELEESAKNIINNEIHAVQSSLVEKLLKDEIIPYDDIQNYYVYPEWNKTVVGEKLYFIGGTDEQREAFMENFDRLKEESEDLLTSEEISDKTNEDNINQIDEAKEEFENLETEPQEVYEWWLVSDWLKEKLLEQGEPIIDNEYGIWWGRTSSGQQIVADGIIQKILKKINVGKYKKGGKTPTAKSTPDEQGYNGWKNYETWNVKLWIDNEQGSQNYWNERADEVYKESKKSEHSTKKEEATHTLADELKDYFDENNPLSEQASTYTDLLNSALSQVSWREIAQNLLEEKKESGGYMAKGGKVGLKEGEKIMLTSAHKSIEKDNYGQGAEPNTRQDVLSDTLNKEFNSAKDFFDYIENNYPITIGDKESFNAFEDGRIIYMQHENSDGELASKDEIKLWKKGGTEMWIADYDFYVEFGTTRTPSVDELSSVFGIKQYSGGGRMAKGGEVGKPTISFQRYHGTDGTVYDQTIKIDNRTYDHLQGAVASEIAMGKPQKDKYVSTSGYEMYLEPLKLENGIVDMNHTQTRFINMFLKLPLKDRNTRLKVVDKYETGGEVGREFQYLKLTPKDNGLEISLTKEGKEKVKEDGLTYDNAYDYFEDIQGNSEYLYHNNLGESGFGLTDAEGITDGYHYGDDGEYETDYPESAKLYFFNRSALVFWGDELKEEGSVFFTEAKESGGYMKKGGKVDITSNYYRFRQHSPKGVSECAVPSWAQKVAEATKSGAKITTCKKDGKWFVQSIMIPKDGVKTSSEARKLAEEIKSKFSRKKKALGGVAETCTCDEIENTKNGLIVLIDTCDNESEKKKYQEQLSDLN